MCCPVGSYSQLLAMGAFFCGEKGVEVPFFLKNFSLYH